MAQRLFDIFISLSALIILLPLLVPTAFILVLTGEGRIFYVQQRVGKGGEHFGVLKFATMLKDSTMMGAGTITVKNDPRVLPFGKFLRKTKINELPQLINILKGEMSLIGPRPLTDAVYGVYDADTKEKIFDMAPGLSGIGSIVFRNEEALLGSVEDSNKLYYEKIAPYKARLECWYKENLSIKLYFCLILITMYVVVAPKSRVIWRLFPELPKPPNELEALA
jgi:lipopolysaccharide/colanic/teichoic acid biosynthesis glycosyltransferase